MQLEGRYILGEKLKEALYRMNKTHWRTYGRIKRYSFVNDDVNDCLKEIMEIRRKLEPSGSLE